MSLLEQAIMKNLEKSGDADDVISKSLRSERPCVEKHENCTNLTRKLFGLAAAASISYGAYILCTEIQQTKHWPLAVPAAIWGACGASYAYRKISNG